MNKTGEYKYTVAWAVVNVMFSIYVRDKALADLEITLFDDQSEISYARRARHPQMLLGWGTSADMCVQADASVCRVTLVCFPCHLPLLCFVMHPLHSR